MKIFATSDIHGNRDIIDKLPSIVNRGELLLICGDIGTKNIRRSTLQEFSKYQQKDADYLLSILNDLPIPARFILGNDDWFEIEDENVNYLSKREKIGEVDLIPFEYVLTTPFSTNREVNENRLNYELHKLSVDKSSIIVAHTPPYGAGDILRGGLHCGSASVKAWIEETQPRIWLCGHIHENNDVKRFGKTYIFNCACYYTDNKLKGWIIDTDDPADYRKIEI
jgi:Icc-related predicted phosphoesterase